MIFTPENCDKIVRGEKTQTRRLVKPDDCTPCAWKAAAGDWFPLDTEWTDGQSVAAVLGDGPRLRWGVGKRYSIQPGRGKSGVGFIEVTAIRYCERARGLSMEDAIAEGFATPSQFCDVFMRLNGGKAIDMPVWALTFVSMGGHQ